jgi:hypothetical protein
MSFENVTERFNDCFRDRFGLRTSMWSSTSGCIVSNITLLERGSTDQRKHTFFVAKNRWWSLVSSLRENETISAIKSSESFVGFMTSQRLLDESFSPSKPLIK